MSSIPILSQAAKHAERIAYSNSNSNESYRDLLAATNQVSNHLLGGKKDLQEERVAYLVQPGMLHSATQWGIWQAGGIAVPLSKSATERELVYALSDSGTTRVVSDNPSESLVQACEASSCTILSLNEFDVNSDNGEEQEYPKLAGTRRAMILYTSGTTSRPKGVVSTHAAITAQIKTLVKAWQWEKNDCIPLFLPLHHIHGIINVMNCALWSGALIYPFQSFATDAILPLVADKRFSVFMAVPTIYVKLIEALSSPGNFPNRDAVINGFRNMRLMISGSAALPASIHESWTELTGQALLERYGMTEIGMALSNPYEGERRPGSVGRALPGVDICLLDENQQTISEENTPGEILVRGDCVFSEYWDRAEVTEQSFWNGWFRTGDMAVLERGYYRIMGRQSVDIIKSGGYKLSALEIESVLLEHEAILQCAVVGLPDDTWGEAVSVAAVLANGSTLDVDALRTWCKGKLSKYKIPKELLVVESLPRNAMGKITKPEVVRLFKGNT